MQQTEHENGQSARQDNRRKLIVSIAVAAVLAVVVISVAYIIINNQTKSPVANMGPVPAIPSKNEVDQLISSIDEDIQAAAIDHSAAAAALEQASTPVKVDL